MTIKRPDIVDAAYRACIAIYNPITPGIFTSILHIGPDIIGLIETLDSLTIVPAGSENVGMWLDNFEINPVEHPKLGMLEYGFWMPAMNIYAHVKPLATGKTIKLDGHSRAASLCGCLAALFLLDGIKVSLAAFESPRWGMRQSVDYMAAQIASGMLTLEISTVNGIDPVPDVPIYPYCIPFVQTELGHAPGGIDDADVIAWHKGETIYAGVVAMFG